MRWIIGSSLHYRRLVLGRRRRPARPRDLAAQDGRRGRAAGLRAPRVEVQTEALGLSAEEVENLITKPMEQEFFNGMAWLHDPLGLGARTVAVELIFEPGTDPSGPPGGAGAAHHGARAARTCPSRPPSSSRRRRPAGS